MSDLPIREPPSPSLAWAANQGMSGQRRFAIVTTQSSMTAAMNEHSGNDKESILFSWR